MPGKIHGLTSVDTQEPRSIAVERVGARRRLLARARRHRSADGEHARAGACTWSTRSPRPAAPNSASSRRWRRWPIASTSASCGSTSATSCSPDSSRPASRSSRSGCPAGTPAGPGRWRPWRLRRELRRWRPDVVHTTLFSANLVGQLAAGPLRIPVVSSFNRTGDIALQRALQPGVAGWKGRIDAGHRPAGRAVRRRPLPGRERVRPRQQLRAVRRAARAGHGRATGDLASAAHRPARTDRRSGSTDGVPLFVNVARLVPEKAQHLLVDAFAEVRAALPDAELAIAGAPGSAEPAVRAAIARHDLDGAVHLLGWRDGRPRARRRRRRVRVQLAVRGIAERRARGDGARDAGRRLRHRSGGRADRRPRPSGAGGLVRRAGRARCWRRTPPRIGTAEIAAARAWADRFALTDVARQLGDLLERRAGRRAGPVSASVSAGVGTVVRAGRRRRVDRHRAGVGRGAPPRRRRHRARLRHRAGGHRADPRRVRPLRDLGDVGDRRPPAPRSLRAGGRPGAPRDRAARRTRG